MRYVYYFLKRKRKEFSRAVYHIYYRRRYNQSPFVIISNNCWGGDIYQALGLPYNTPFIGMFINAPCYIRLLQNPEKYLLNTPMTFIAKSKYPHLMTKPGYPIGVLDDVEVHFLHYSSESEASEKWHRRIKRMDWDKTRWFVKFDDRDNCIDELIREFHQLNYRNKISFTKRIFKEYRDNISLKNPQDLILLYTTYDLFDFVNWLNNKKIELTLSNILMNKLLSYPKKF